MTLDQLSKELQKLNTPQGRREWFQSLPEDDQRKTISLIQEFISNTVKEFEPIVDAYIKYWEEVLLPCLETMAEICGIKTE